MDFSEYFNVDDGCVIYFDKFIENPDETFDKLVSIGFPKGKNRTRGGLSPTGTECLVSEKTIGSGVGAMKWPKTVSDIASKISKVLYERNIIQEDKCIDYCLYNKYDSGKESISFHSDSEKNSLKIIASISLGFPRKFLFMENISRDLLEMNLKHGSLLLIAGDVNSKYMHCVPPEGLSLETRNTCRINLTFRVLCEKKSPEKRMKRTIVPSILKRTNHGSFKRIKFCEDFWFISPLEALNQEICFMYRRWGKIGWFSSDKELISKKVNSVRDNSSIEDTTMWFLMPNSLSSEQLYNRLLSMQEYMLWKYQKIIALPSDHIRIKHFAQVYTESPKRGKDRNYTILIPRV